MSAPAAVPPDLLLPAAVERGILRPEQAAALQALAAELAAAPVAPASAGGPDPDDEKLRFISGFNDIFVGIGVCLFLGAIALLVGEHAGAAVTAAIVAGASWALAEVFTRRRRMSLPSIQLLTVFAVSVFIALLWGFAALTGGTPDIEPRGGDWLPLATLARDTPAVTIAASLLTCGAVALHYLRFRVPVTVAAGAGALVLAGLAAVLWAAPGWGWQNLSGLSLAGGLGVLALAMHFDLGDLERTSRRTDIAFWLHLLAASLIIHPVVTAVAGDFRLEDLDRQTALLILATLAALSLVALAIDRRAILTAGLVYAGFAFYTLIENADFASGTFGPSTFGLSVLALGAYVLAISVLWRPLRNGLLRLLPENVARLLPRPVHPRA